MIKKRYIGKYISIILLIFASALVIIPLLIMLFGSFKTSVEASLFNILPPKVWQLQNYSFVFVQGKILRALTNSFFVTGGTLIVSIPTAALCAFVLARKNSLITKIVRNLFYAGMIAPFQVITTFGLLKALNLIGSSLGVILIFTAIQLPWNIFLLSNFLKNIPRELDEAAFIDGANPIETFTLIILPVLKPVLATTIVMTAMTVWNDFMIPLYFLNSSKKWTMPLTVYNFFGRYFSDWNYVFADLVFTALPIIILYLFAQKYIVSGLMAGSIKG